MQSIETALFAAPADKHLVEVIDRNGQVTTVLTYGAARNSARRLADGLDGAGVPGLPRKVGLVMGNTPTWVVADLGLMLAGATEIPVPLAFAADQAASLLEEAEVCLVDSPGAARLATWGRDTVLPSRCPVVEVSTAGDLLGQTSTTATATPRSIRHEDRGWVCKIIHTSGTTSRPKGVKIRSSGLEVLLGSLGKAVPPGCYERYVSLVPLSLLIEQVTAVYMVILNAGTLVLLPEDMPLLGTSGAAVDGVLTILPALKPTAMVVTPSLAEGLANRVDALDAASSAIPARALFGTDNPPLMCCGGAPVAPEVLDRLAGAGIPVFEGYGLSENSSVVSWNTPAAHRRGTVGKPLDHVEVRVADDGELLIRGPSLFAGYTREDPSSCLVDKLGWLHTGDLAAIDADGFIQIQGRKKNIIITAQGRNVAPEWVEARYKSLPCITAAIVLGDGLNELHGVFLVPDEYDHTKVEAEIRSFGEANLSEVERVAVVHIIAMEEAPYREWFTVTGRPRRTAVAQHIFSGSQIDMSIMKGAS